MRNAVLHDLNQLPGITTSCAFDPRLPEPAIAHETVQIFGDDAWTTWQECIAQADAVLPIAPETNGALLSLTSAINDQGKILLGCSEFAVSLTSSKLATSQILQAAGIRVVPTFKAEQYSEGWTGKWVAKPDDGVGCEGTILFASQEELSSRWQEGNPKNHVVQPFLDGEPASISMLCDKGRAWLLSCNRQKVSIKAGTFIYHGSVLNGVANHWIDFESLAQSIARAIPSLRGYVGVDVIIHQGEITVLEINPRFTTSYAGLNEAMGCNPAGLLIDLLYNSHLSPDGFRMPSELQRNKVDVCLDE